MDTDGDAHSHDDLHEDNPKFAMDALGMLLVPTNCGICGDFHFPHYFWQVLNIVVCLKSLKCMFLSAVLLVLEETAPVGKVCSSGLHVFRNCTCITEYAGASDTVYCAGMGTSAACLRNITINHRFPVSANSGTAPGASNAFSSLFVDWVFDS